MQKKLGFILIALASLIITSCGCSTNRRSSSNISSEEPISESSHASSSDKSSSSNDSKSSNDTSSQNSSSSNSSSQNSSSSNSSSGNSSSSSEAPHVHNFVKNPDTLEYVCSCGEKNGRDFEMNITIPQIHVGDTVSARDYTFSFKNDDGALVFGFVMFWASSQEYFTDKYIPNTMLGKNVDAYVFVGVHDATNVKYTDPNNIGDDTKLENCTVYCNGQATTCYMNSVLNNIYPDSEPSVIGSLFFGYKCSIGQVLASTAPMVAWPTSDVNAAFQTMGLEPFALPELQDPAITSYEVHVYNNSKAFYIAFFGLKNADVNYTVKFYADKLPTLGFSKIENYKYLSPDETFTVYTASTIGSGEQILDIELYEKPTYTVTWVGFDGQVVETDQNVEQGTMPHFDGDLSGYESKNGNAYYYTGWDKTLAPVTGNVTYTAQWYESIFIMDEEYDDGWNVAGLANKNYAGVVTVPSTFFDGRPVKYIAPGAFSGCSNVTKLVIPTSIIRIGEAAFEKMVALTELTIPFVGRTKNATGEEGLFGWFFGSQIFAGLDQAAQMYDSSHVIYKQLPMGLTKVNVMDGNLSYGAFYNCRYLETVSLPNTQTIGEQAFAYTTGLKNVQFMEGNDKLQRIEDQAFLRSGIQTITLPKSVNYIGNKAFRHCASLTSFYAMDEDNNLLGGTIGWWLFEGCSSLQTLAIPVFGHIGTLFSNSEFDGSYDMLIATEMYYMPSSLKNVIVTSGALSEKAFELTTITNVTLTSNITFVNEGALAGMLSLTTLSTAFFGKNIEDTTPSDSTVLGYFFGQTKVNSTDYLANQHWNGNTGQVNYYIPATLTSVIFSGSFLSPGAFHQCKKITSIQLTGSITSIGRWTFDNCPAEVSIPSTVTTLASYAYGQSGIVTAIIPDAVTELPDTAFSHAEQLTTVVIGNGVTLIGDDCFSNCVKLSSVTFGTGALTINNYAFDKCTSLTSITLPAELVRLKGWIFRGCTNLTTINFAGTKEQWNSVTKATNWLGNDAPVTVVHCSNGDVTL